MVIIPNVTIYFPKLHPKFPNRRYEKPDNPATWEVQIRTTSKEEKKVWESLGLRPKTIDPDDGELFYTTTIRKKIVDSKGNPNLPPQLVGGRIDPSTGELEVLDPSIIGNGSKANLKVFQYPKQDGNGVVSILMGVQITKLVPYKGAALAQFEETDFEIEDEDDQTPF